MQKGHTGLHPLTQDSASDGGQKWALREGETKQIVIPLPNTLRQFVSPRLSKPGEASRYAITLNGFFSREHVREASSSPSLKARSFYQSQHPVERNHRLSMYCVKDHLLLFAFNLAPGGNQVIPSSPSTGEGSGQLICHPLSDTYVLIQISLISLCSPIFQAENS